MLRLLIEKAVLEKLLKLLPDRQKEVLNVVETLETNAGQRVTVF